MKRPRSWILLLLPIVLLIFFLNEIRQPGVEPMDFSTAGTDNTNETARVPAVPGRKGAIAPGPVSGHDTTVESLPAGNLRDELERLDPEIVQSALDQLREHPLPEHDLINSVHVDKSGGLYYVCAIPKDQTSLITDDKEERVKPAQAEGPSAPDPEAYSYLESLIPGWYNDLSVPVSHPPIFNSRPGAPHTVFLDFNGHVVENTAWNDEFGVESYNCAPIHYYSASDAKYFETSTLTNIVKICEQVAESFSSFNVNVTTVQPEIMDNSVLHVLITSEKTLDGIYNPRAQQASGVAYLDFYGTTDHAWKSPVFVYSDTFNSLRIADTATHEIGHALGLGHDGNSTEEYYPGHLLPNGHFGWAAFMGGGLGNSQMVQWSKGDYFDANNQEDDIAIINGKFGTISDHVASAMAQAVTLEIFNSSFYISGSLENSLDEDWFRIELPEYDNLEIRLNRDGRSLDYYIEIYNSSGELIGSRGSESVNFGTVYWNPETLATGTHYLRVVPESWGTPSNDPPTGYTTYGSQGSYILNGKVGEVLNPQKYSKVVDQTESVTAVCGTLARFDFTVANLNDSFLDYYWEYSADMGATWTQIYEGAQNRTEYFLSPVLPWMDGYLFRCRIQYGNNETIYTEDIPLKVITLEGTNPFPVQLSDEYAVLPDDSSITFSVEMDVERDENVAWFEFQHYQEINGSVGWYNLGIDDYGAGSVQVTSTSQDGGRYRFRCLTHSGEYYTNEAILHVSSVPLVSIPLLQLEVPAGAATKIVADLAPDSSPVDSYQWQYRLTGEPGWTDVIDNSMFAGTSTNVLRIHAAPQDWDNSEWRLYSTNAQGNTISDTVRLTVAGDVRSGIIEASIDDFHQNQIFVRSDGSLWGFGRNSDYNLGLDHNSNQLEMVEIVPEGVVACTTAISASYFVRNDGTLWAMGVGIRTSETSGLKTLKIPTQIYASFNNVVDITSDNYDCWFLTADHNLWHFDRDTSTPNLFREDVLYLGKDYILTETGEYMRLKKYHYDLHPGLLNVLYDYNNNPAVGLFPGGEFREIGGDPDAEPIESQVVDSFPSEWLGVFYYLKTDNSLWKFDTDSDSLEFVQIGISSILETSDVENIYFTDVDGWIYRSRHDYSGGNITVFEGYTDRLTPEMPAVIDVSYTHYGALLSWSPPVGGRSFSIWRSPSDNFSDGNLVATSVTKNYWIDLAAGSTTEYRYWVRSDNFAGSSAWKGPARLRLIAPPGNVRMLLDAEIVHFQWDSTPLPLSYKIARSPTDNFAESVIVAADISGATWEDTVLRGSSAYYWIQAFNQNSTSEWIGPFERTVLPIPKLLYMVIEANKLVADWRPILEAQGYEYSLTFPSHPNEPVIGQTSEPILEVGVSINNLPELTIQSVLPDGSKSEKLRANLVELNAVDGVVNYEAFKLKYFDPADQQNPEITGYFADPDGDGRVNIEEYAFYGNPLTPDSQDMNHQVHFTGGPYTHVTYDIPMRPALPELHYQLYKSHDLVNWQPFEPLFSVLTGVDGRNHYYIDTDLHSENMLSWFYQMQISPAESTD